MSRPPAGQAWVYESIVGSVPGVAVGSRQALALQFAGFEVAVLGLGWWEGLPVRALLAGTVVVVVASVGSAAMTGIADLVRRAEVPRAYGEVLLGSRIDIVLGLLAYVGLVTYLFVYDPRSPPELLATLLGEDPSLPVAYLVLLLCWDVCYRIGTAWWASVVGLWRSLTLPVGGATRARLRQADLATMAFGVLQLALVPFLVDHPLLLWGVLGHVAAVLLVTGSSVAVLARREN